MAIARIATQYMLIKETTWGTALTPTVSLPVTPPKPKIIVGSLYDEAYRAIASKQFAYYQGVRHSEAELDTYFWPDVSGHGLMSVMGTDVVTGAGPFTHSFALALTTPSYTFSDYNGITGTNTNQYAGMTATEFLLKWTAPTLLMTNWKIQGKYPTLIAQPTFAAPSTNIFIGWQCAATIAGAGNTRLIDAEVSIKREFELIYGMSASQDPTDRVVSAMEVKGKLLFAINDFTELNYYLNNTQPIVSLLFTSGTNTLTLQMSKCAFETPTELMRDKIEQTVSASFTAIYNTTDAGPIKPILVNGQSTAY